MPGTISVMRDFLCRTPSFEEPLYVVPVGTKREGRPEYKLVDGFSFEIGGWGSKTYIEVPEAFITDFASIPWGFRWILPPNGPWLKAAVIHDFMYENAPHFGWRRAYCDMVFLEGMRTLGVRKVTRLVMYSAVRLFGSKNFGKVVRATSGSADYS